MLSELRIAKTHAVDAQPRANARVTIACSCSLSSKPPYRFGFRMCKRPASASARNTCRGIARLSSVSTACSRNIGTRASAALITSGPVSVAAGTRRRSSCESVGPRSEIPTSLLSSFASPGNPPRSCVAGCAGGFQLTTRVSQRRPGQRRAPGASSRRWAVQRSSIRPKRHTESAIAQVATNRPTMTKPSRLS